MSAADSSSARAERTTNRCHAGPRRRSAAEARPARRARRPRSTRRRHGGRRPTRRGAGAARAGSPPAARPGASCSRPARTSTLSREPWKRSIRARSAIPSSEVTIAPPSPKQPRFFDGKNEKVAVVPSDPARPDPLVVPTACAASSSTGTPSASISATGARLPNRSTATTAFVRGVERGLHGLGRDAERFEVDVAEHRRGARRRDRLGTRVERERRHDDFVAWSDPHRAQRDRQRVRAVGDADCMLHPAVGGELRSNAVTSGPRMKL